MAFSKLTGKGIDLSTDIITEFNSTGIDDNATSTAITIAANNSVAIPNLHGNTTTIGNLTVGGDFTVTGTNFAVDSTSLKIEDSLIHLAGNNVSSDIVDIGFIGHYSNDSGNTELFTGFYRDATDEQYYLFNGLSDDINTATTIDKTGTGFTLASLNVGNFTSTGIDDNATGKILTLSGSSTANNSLVTELAQTSTSGYYLKSTSYGLEAYEAVNSLSTTLRLKGGGNTILSHNSAEDGIRLRTNDTDRLFIKSTGEVGIGTAGPGALLHVYNDVDAEEQIIIAETFGDYGSEGTGISFVLDQTEMGHVNAHKTRGMTFYVTPGSEAAAIERMRIDTSGRLGIGTSPSYLVDARTSSGNAQIYLRSGGDLAQLLLISDDTTGTSQINFGDADANNIGLITYTHNLNAFRFTVNSAEAMRIASSGNVAIGNTNATYILDVDVGAPASSDQVLGRFSSQNGVRDIGFVWDDSASTLGVATLTSHGLTFHTGGNSNERMRINTSGDVGIGTTNPDTKLHVSGGINTGPATAGSTDAAFIVSNADDAYGIHMNVSGSSGAGFISAQRNDGSAVVYDLVLQPTGGRLRSPAQYGLGKTGESYDNDQSFEKFNFKLGNTSSAYANVWMKVCTVTIPDTAYTAISLTANFKYNNNNFGNTDYLSENLTHIRLVRNGGAGTGGSVSASLYGMDGPQSDNIRVYVTSASTAEIQVKHTVSNRAMHVDFQIVDHNGAIELDHVNTPTTGTTSGGTAYTPALSSSATTGRWLALNGLMINQQGLYAAGNQLAAQNTVWNKSVATWNKQATVSGTGYFHSFIVNNSDVGSISTNGTTTAYNTTSDYRLKENIVDLTGAIDRLKQIPVHRFNFIAAANTTVDGFLAHEVSDIVPEAVSGEKDAVETVYDEEANTSTEVAVYQGIDQSKLVPLLTAALKEAILRIETLEAAQANTA